MILVTGVLAITLPTLWTVQRFTGYGPSIDVSMPSILGRSRNTETPPNTDPEPEPVPEQETNPEPEPRPRPRDRNRPLLDLVGRLADHLRHQRRDDMEPIDIVELENDDYRYDNDDR